LPEGRERAAFVLVAMAVVAGASDARAQGVEPKGSAGTAQAAAEGLFVEGKRLMEAREYPLACEKFAESERLDPAAGTLLNLADCYEKNGQLASAWVTFREATTAAERSGRVAWAEQAAARARLLEPQLPTLTVQVDPAQTPGIEITRNDIPVTPSVWGSPVPVDPSISRIEAHAPNKKPWATTVTVDAVHPRIVVAVPPLEELPPPREKGGIDVHRAAPGASPSQVGPLAGPLTLIALGAVGVGVGTYFGIRTFQLKDESNQECVPTCTDHARQSRSAAQTDADAATVSFVGAGAFLAAGAAWWWFGRRGASRGSTVRVLPVVGSSWNGLALTGDL
jgi:hypothetical protein